MQSILWYNKAMNKEQMYNEVMPYMHKHWARMLRLWPTLAHHPMPALQINTRTFRTAGCCEGDALFIELSLKLYNGNQRVMLLEILAHELIHAADRLLNGCWYTESTKRQTHGPIWKAMMQAYGLPAKTYHTLTVK